MRASRDFVIGARVLLLSATRDATAEPALGLARRILDGFGIPYDHVPLTEGGRFLVPGPLRLEEQLGHGLYYGVILATDQLAFQNPETHQWQSALRSEQWLQLMQYEATYGARRVSLYSQPTDQLGVALEGQAGAGSSRASIHPQAVGYASGLNSNMRVATANTWRYPTRIADPVRAREFVTFDQQRGPVAAAETTFTYAGGATRKELHFFFSQNPFDPASIGLGTLWVQWLSRGLYVGKRRVYLNVQVDDVFLPNDLWDPDTHRVPVDGSRSYRMGSTDAVRLTDWQRALSSRLDPQSAFRTELAFNGGGVNEAGGPSQDPLYKSLRTLHTFFDWVSHTFTHPNLTNFSYQRTVPEVRQNQAFASDLLGSPPAGLSANEMVTPDISGLFNERVLRALADNGITSVVGDNTVAGLRPDNPHLGRWTTLQQNGWAGTLIVPRNATELYYSTSTPAEWESQFNSRYSSLLGRVVALPEILDLEARRVLLGTLSFEAAPHMFHQANLRQGTDRAISPITGRPTASLLAMWVEAVIARLREISSLPILHASFHELAQSYRARMQLAECGAQGELEVQAGMVTRLHLRSNAACEVPVTAPTALTRADDAPEPRHETYGPDLTSWIEMNGATLPTLALEAPLAWIEANGSITP